MDDFGSGFSSLNLLRRLPIHVLKLDKEFLREGYETDRTQSILSDIVVMAQHLGIRTVCEGVETPEHVALLREIGCDTAQGFYYLPPPRSGCLQEEVPFPAVRPPCPSTCSRTRRFSAYMASSARLIRLFNVNGALLQQLPTAAVATTSWVSASLPRCSSQRSTSFASSASSLSHATTRNSSPP